jgi:NADPH:quinone reductase-like Zn-dependent oxidoreductase
MKAIVIREFGGPEVLRWLDLKRLYQRRLHVMSDLGAERREDPERARQLGMSGKVYVLIDQVMPLREPAAAHRLVATNLSVGKIVLDPTLEWMWR